MTRSYTMRARAESTAETRQRILDAVNQLSYEQLSVQIALTDVAERAGVSVQTVLRHFGTKDALFEAAWDLEVVRVRGERTAPVGDVGAAVAVIVGSYERTGDWAVRLQAVEHTEDLARRVVTIGRKFHRAWVEEVFASQLDGRADRAELVELLIVATDVLTWKILRRDARLSRRATCGRMQRLVRAVLSSAAGP
jgi:AcrR family transcriptional regulator